MRISLYIINKYIKEYKSITEASINMNIDRKVIRDTIKKNSVYKKRYIFYLKNNKKLNGTTNN